MPAAIKVLFAVDLLFAAMHLWNPAVPEWAARGEATDYLWDLDREANLPTWYASVQLALIGALLGGFGLTRAEHSRREALILGGAGVAFVVMSLDEQTLLHEKVGRGIEELIGHRDTTAFDVIGPWALVAAPIFVALAVAAGLALRNLFRGRRRPGWLIGPGLALYAVSFAGLELAANAVSITRERYTVLIEETGEMVGTTLILWGVYELMRSHGIAVMGRAPASPARPPAPP